MGLLTKISLLVVLSGFALNPGGSVTHAQIPNRGIQRLDSMAREMLKRPLTDDDRETLIAEIARAAVDSARTGQDPNYYYYQEGDLGKLFREYFPEVFERIHNDEWTLTDMVRYFHSLAIYRPIIDAVLKGAKANGNCKK